MATAASHCYLGILFCLCLCTIGLDAQTTEAAPDNSTVMADGATTVAPMTDGATMASVDSSTAMVGNNNGSSSDNSSSQAVVSTVEPSAENTTDSSNGTNAGNPTAEPEPENTNHTSANATSAPEGEPTAGGNGNTNSNNTQGGMVTAEPTQDPENSTSTTQPIQCYECSGAGCENLRTSSHNTCTSALGICFITYNMAANVSVASRGCNSTVAYKTKCLSDFPAGEYASEKCEYCCINDKCNGAALTESQCNYIRNNNAAKGFNGISNILVVALLTGSWILRGPIVP